LVNLPRQSEMRRNAKRQTPLLEPLENDWVTIFLPQAPTPMSGNLMYLPAGRVRPLGISMVTAMAIVKRMGVGSGEALRGADLTLPAGA
jgi:uncharacterized membrane protein